jgi:hypothetical protein
LGGKDPAEKSVTFMHRPAAFRECALVNQSQFFRDPLYGVDRDRLKWPSDRRIEGLNVVLVVQVPMKTEVAESS